MNYKILFEKKCNYIEIFKDLFVLNEENKDLFISFYDYNFNIIKSVQIPDSFDSCFLNPPECYIRFENGDLAKIEYLNEGKIDFIVDEYKFYNTKIINEILPCYHGSIFNRKCGLFNIKKKEILFLNPEFKGDFFLTDSIIANIVEEGISLYNLDGSLIFSFDLRSLPPYKDIFNNYQVTQVERFIGLANDILWIGLTDRTILLIDIKTGNQLDILPHKDEPVNKNPYFPSTKSMYLDEKSGTVLGGAGPQLWEIDTFSYHVQYWNLDEYFTEQKVNISSGYGDEIAFDSDYIYFLDKENSKVAILNRKNKTIEWQYTFVSESKWRTMPMKIQVEGDRLYVVDDKKMLHVFERE